MKTHLVRGLATLAGVLALSGAAQARIPQQPPQHPATVQCDGPDAPGGYRDMDARFGQFLIWPQLELVSSAGYRDWMLRTTPEVPKSPTRYVVTTVWTCHL